MKLKFSRTAIYAASIHFIGQLSGIVLGITLARLMGPTLFGVYAFAFALLRIGVIFVEFGMPVIATRETVRLLSRKDMPSLRGLIIFGRLVIGVNALIAFLFSIVYIFVFDTRSWNESDEMLLASLSALFFIALLRFNSSALRGAGKMIMGQTLELLLYPVGLIGLVIFLSSNTIEITPSRIMWSHVIITSSLVLASAVLLRRTLGHRFKTAQPQFNPGTWARNGVSFLFVGGALFANTQIDVVMMGTFHENYQVGQYRAAAQAALLVVLFSQIVQTIVSPSFAKHHENKEFLALRQTFFRAQVAASTGAGAVLLAYLLFSENILSLVYGNDYRLGSTALLILSAGFFAKISFGPLEVLFSMVGAEKALFKILLFSVFINIIFNAILIPQFGASGAATATAITSCVTPLWLQISCRRLGLLRS